MNKQNELKLQNANKFKQIFIERYNYEECMNELTEIIQDVDYKNAIDMLAKDLNIKEILNYQELRKIAIKIKRYEGKKVFIQVCKNNNLEDWINDNGNYNKIVIDAFIQVFKHSEEARQCLLINNLQ